MSAVSGESRSATFGVVDELSTSSTICATAGGAAFDGRDTQDCASRNSAVTPCYLTVKTHSDMILLCLCGTQIIPKGSATRPADHANINSTCQPVHPALQQIPLQNMPVPDTLVPPS